MKNFKLLLFIIIALSINACTGGYGKEYKLDSKHNVYYKGEGVDEALAKKLAAYLKEQDYFQDSINSTVQLVKVKDTFKNAEKAIIKSNANNLHDLIENIETLLKD